MDKRLTRAPPIDSKPFVWMPLAYRLAKIGLQLPQPCIHPKFVPTPDPDIQEELDETRSRMLPGLIRIMLWIVGISTANDNKRILRARFLRTIVVLWVIDPNHFECATQASMARRYKFDKQSFNASVTSFRKAFDYADVRFRSPLAVAHMRKPSHE